MARTPRRLPRLDRAQIETLDRRLRSMNIMGRDAILASLNAAANPQAETPEFGLSSLPQSRRSIAERSIAQSSLVFDNAVSQSIGLDELQAFDEALQEAQVEQKEGLDWSLVLLLLGFFLISANQQDDLEEFILSAYIDAYMLGIRESAASHGCNASPRRPSGSQLAQLKQWAKQDAQSIGDTYQREAQNELQRLWLANPLGNIAYYTAGMTAWANQRKSHKSITIAINNAQKGYWYGQEQFILKNGLAISSKWRFAGVPPICPICVRLFGLGHVDFATAQSNPLPAHVNCPHYWEEVNPKNLGCEGLWLG